MRDGRTKCAVVGGRLQRRDVPQGGARFPQAGNDYGAGSLLELGAATRGGAVW
jgi:hypothetical protein